MTTETTETTAGTTETTEMTETTKTTVGTTTEVLPKVAALMMLKNESKRLSVTLKSLVGVVKGLIIFDTGSTDNTIEILEGWCEENKVALHLTKGEFVDFSKSRNELFDFSDTIEGYDFHLLLDCNDELQNPQKFLEECQRSLSLPEQVFMIRQRWLTGTYVNKYMNTRLVKPRHGWRYKKRVHEYMAPPEESTNVIRGSFPDDIVLFQNRNDDDDKTSRRFVRDKEFLLEDVRQYNDPRDMFYLAQTLSCLEEFDEAYNWYQKRGEIIEGFWEERFHSYLRSAEIAFTKKNDIDLAIANFFKAAMIDYRAEPLVALGKIYREKQEFILAYHFLKSACELEFPKNNILFVSENDYVYERWQQLSVIAYYVGKYSVGRHAIETVRATGRDLDVHQQNQSFYDTAMNEGKKDAEEFALDEPLSEELTQVYNSFILEGRQNLVEKNIDEAIVKFLNAFQLTRRATGLLLLAEYCRIVNAIKMTWCMASLACELQIPDDMPKKEREYSYLRWHLAGISGFYTGHIKEGKEACLKAIKSGQNINIDRKNLVHYLEAEKSSPRGAPSQGTPPQEIPKTVSELSRFKERRVSELMSLNPKMEKRQAEAKAQLEWKLMKRGS